MINPTIKVIYAKEFACLDKLKDLLDRERDSLKSRDTAQILAATEDKQVLLRELDSLDKQRRSFKAGMSASVRDDSSFKNWIEENDRKLEKTLKGFMQANRVNMGIVELGRLFTEQMLAILRGQPHTSTAGEYDPQGGREKNLHSKSLAKV